MLVRESKLNDETRLEVNSINTTYNGLVILPVFKDDMTAVTGILYGEPGRVSYSEEPDNPQVRRTMLALNKALSGEIWEEGRFAIPIISRINQERPFEYHLPIEPEVYFNATGTAAWSKKIKPNYAVVLTDKVMSLAVKSTRHENLYKYLGDTYIFKLYNKLIFIDPKGNRKDSMDLQSNSSILLSGEDRDMLDALIHSLNNQQELITIITPVPDTVLIDYQELNKRIMSLLQTHEIKEA